MSASPVQCRVCGADCPKSHVSSPRKFCSRKCYWASKEGHPLPISPEMLAKAQKQGTRKAAKKIRGSTQSHEHRDKRLKATWDTLAAIPIACCHCGDFFTRTAPGHRYCSGRCWVAAHRKRHVTREKRFAIPIAEYRRLLALQENRCAICGVLSGSNGRNDRLSVDHCHDRMVVRGLLCHRCNTALGLFRDDSAVLAKARDYLDSYR